MEWPQLGWLDIAMLGVVALSALIGLVRGVTFELLSLAGWFVAWFAAWWLEPVLAPHLPIGEVGTALNRGTAFVLAFLGVMIVWSLASRAVSSLIKATPLKPVDRLLGAAFGVARGLVVLLALATLVAYTPLARAETWRNSEGAAILDTILKTLLPLLPADAMPAALREA